MSDKALELAKLPELILDPIVLLSSEGGVLWLNQAALSLYGWTLSEVIGQPFFQILEGQQLPSPLPKAFVFPCQQAVQFEVTETYFKATQKTVQWGIKRYPLKSKKQAILLLGRDVTDQTTLEKALLAKSEFITNMSHDIRTPIMGILAMSQKIVHQLNFTQAALHQGDKKAVSLLKELIESVYQDQSLLMRSTHRLLALCDDILETAQLESGQLIEPIEIFNLEDSIQHTIGLLRAVAREKKLNLLYHFSTAVPRYFKGERLSLERVLLNLTSNALKFTEKGFVRIGIGLTDQQHVSPPFKLGDRLQLTLYVEDSGVGIPNDQLEVVFERFSKLASSSENSYKGSGLGLYAVKRCVEAMQGHIEVSSELGRGTRFTITLPLVVADAGDFKSTEPLLKRFGLMKTKIGRKLNVLKRFKSLKQQKFHSHSTQLKPLKPLVAGVVTRADILIVEDNAVVAIGMQLTLNTLHCTADLAENGAQALSMVKQGQYKLVLMDMGLPDFSGAETTQKIRSLSDSQRAQVPIVAVSGHANHQDRRQSCLEAGMQAVLDKPPSQGEIESVLRQYVLGLEVT